MKRSLLLLVLPTFLLLLSSCEKNPEVTPEPTTAETLLGSWQESSSTLTLYNSNSTKISEEAQPLRSVNFYPNHRFDYRYVNDATLEGMYKLTSDANNEFIVFTIPEESMTFTIVQLSAKSLTVSCETHNVTYYVDDKPLIAATAIRKMTLTKCKN